MYVRQNDLLTSDHCSASLFHQEFLILLKGGASLDLNSVKPKPFKWMLDIIWLNLVELCNLEAFRDLMSLAVGKDKEWKSWCDKEQPEEEVSRSEIQHIQHTHWSIASKYFHV